MALKEELDFTNHELLPDVKRTTYANEEDLTLSASPTQPSDLELIATIGEQMLEHCY